jgi:tetratricopeptide (TPR) repeat protein
MWLKVLGPNDPDTLFTLHNIATMHLHAGRTAEAMEQLEAVRDAKFKHLGPEHPDTLPTLNNLATAYWQAKQLDKSLPLFEQLLPLHLKILGETHPTTIIGLANLGVNYRDAGRLPEAIPLMEKANRLARIHPTLRWIGGELLLVYVRANKPAEATTLVKENLLTARNELPSDSARLAVVLWQCGTALLELNLWAEAEPLLRECLSIRQKREPDDWRTFGTESSLGEALMRQQKYGDAEPLLIRGYEGMKHRATRIPAIPKFRMMQAIERLVHLYDGWGKPNEVAMWRKELELAKFAVPVHSGP